MSTALPPEVRVNMSLEDLIKAKKKEKKAPKANTSPASTGAASGVGAKKKRRKSKGVKPEVTKMDTSVKQAQAIGKSKANRAALTNKLRGLNSTGKATKQEIAVAVTKQTNALKKRKQNVAAKLLKPKVASGLKISFNTAELGKTTDKTVQMQIRGALSKQAGKKAGKAVVPVNAILGQSSRQVQVGGGAGGGKKGKGKAR